MTRRWLCLLLVLLHLLSAVCVHHVHPASDGLKTGTSHHHPYGDRPHSHLPFSWPHAPADAGDEGETLVLPGIESAALLAGQHGPSQPGHATALAQQPLSLETEVPVLLEAHAEAVRLPFSSPHSPLYLTLRALRI